MTRYFLIILSVLLSMLDIANYFIPCYSNCYFLETEKMVLHLYNLSRSGLSRNQWVLTELKDGFLEFYYIPAVFNILYSAAAHF